MYLLVSLEEDVDFVGEATNWNRVRVFNEKLESISGYVNFHPRYEYPTATGPEGHPFFR